VTAPLPLPSDQPESPRRATESAAAKSAAAFRTTGEVAEELDLPTHVLRFWEAKFPQVKPLKRGGGRRYYRPEDVELLRRIRQCLYQQGYTIRGVQKLLRDGALPRAEALPCAEDSALLSCAFEPSTAPPPGLPRSQVPRAVLEELRRDLLEIRDLLNELGGRGDREPA
jgi:DNA-binding transcriptional MerR regulator